jgi:hypothetical protein
LVGRKMHRNLDKTGAATTIRQQEDDRAYHKWLLLCSPD